MFRVIFAKISLFLFLFFFFIDGILSWFLFVPPFIGQVCRHAPCWYCVTSSNKLLVPVQIQRFYSAPENYVFVRVVSGRKRKRSDWHETRLVLTNVSVPFDAGYTRHYTMSVAALFLGFDLSLMHKRYDLFGLKWASARYGRVSISPIAPRAGGDRELWSQQLPHYKLGGRWWISTQNCSTKNLVGSRSPWWNIECENWKSQSISLYM